MSSPDQQALVAFSIRVAGQPLPSDIDVVSIEVSGKSDGTARARVTINADPVLAASRDLGPGATIAIDAGYDATLSAIFSGVLQSVELESTPAGGLMLIVEATGQQETTAGAAPVLTLTYGEDIASLKLRREGDALSGELGFQGSALAVPGAAVALAGLGERFDGVVTLTRVQHVIRDGNWTTTAGTGPDNRTIQCDNLTVRAKGNITLDAGANLALAAKASATTQALNIEQTATTSFAARGTAQATVAASGLLTLEGAMVKIN